MKILQVAFLLLFNYLDSLPKLYYKTQVPKAVSLVIEDFPALETLSIEKIIPKNFAQT